MSWFDHHTRSEHYAARAVQAVAGNEADAFRELYCLAAKEEEAAFGLLHRCRVKKRSLTATRTVALWLNAGNRTKAEVFAKSALSDGGLTPTAANQIREMLVDPTALITDRLAAKMGAPPSKPQLTALTPNSNCSAVGSNDANNSVLIQFMSPPNKIGWWVAMASDALLPVVNPFDQGNAVVTFKAGLTVSYRAMGGNNYNVLMSGNIVDSGATYPYTGAVLYSSSLSVQTICR